MATIKPVKPPSDYVWRRGYQGIYINPGQRFHKCIMYVQHRDPCGQPGLKCTIGSFDENAPGVAIDEDKLWLIEWV